MSPRPIQSISCHVCLCVVCPLGLNFYCRQVTGDMWHMAHEHERWHMIHYQFFLLFSRFLELALLPTHIKRFSFCHMQDFLIVNGNIELFFLFVQFEINFCFEESMLISKQLCLQVSFVFIFSLELVWKYSDIGLIFFGIQIIWTFVVQILEIIIYSYFLSQLFCIKIYILGPIKISWVYIL